MSFYRLVERGIWSDEVVFAASREAKLLWAYLCCNDHDDLSGIYRLSPAAVAEDIGLGRGEFLAALSELSERVTYDPKARVVWVHNMLWKQGKTRDGDIGSKHLKHTQRQLETLPATETKVAMCDYYRRRYGKEIGYPQKKMAPLPQPSVSASASASVSESVSGPPPDQPAYPTVRFIGHEPDPLLDAINAALCVSITPAQHGKFYTSAAERKADGVPVEVIEAVLRAWVADPDPKKPRRTGLFFAKNWEWTRRRYYDVEPPTESHGEATGEPEPEPERMDHEKLRALTSGLVRRVGEDQ